MQVCEKKNFVDLSALVGNKLALYHYVVKKKRTLLLSFLLFAVLIQPEAQNTIGIPNIINYSKQTYAAGSQNWNMAQDKRGIVYFANNDGLLSFDGAFWRLYKLPNRTIARSVAVGEDGKIYVGGQGEIGFFSPGKNAELEYTSLNKGLSQKDNDFADVWNICFYKDNVFFRANKKILQWDGRRISVYNSINWGFLGMVNDELLANENDKGLVYYINGDWQPKIRSGKLPTDNYLLRTALPVGKDSVLLVSLMHGLHILHHDTVSIFETPAIKEAASKNIAAACMISAGRIALATNLGGCFIIDKQGRFIQRFTKKEGIQNNNVLSVLSDKDKNLWLGLDNGLDLITYGNAIKNIFPDQEDRNAGYTSALYKDRLYLGVSTGAYSIPLGKEVKDLSYTNGSFSFIDNSKGQVWNFSEVDGKLLMSHNKGAYIINDNNVVPLDTKTGFWGFQSVASAGKALVMGGTYGGINFYTSNNGVWSDPVVYSQVESARFVVMGNNILWIAHPYKGLYSIHLDSKGPGVAEKYKDKKGVLSSNHNKIFKIKGKVILASDNGVFEYDEKQADFVPAVWLSEMIGKEPVSYLKEDKQGNTWFCRDRKVSVASVVNGKINRISIPELDGRIMGGGFENINVLDSNNVLIAAEKGFFHINYALYKKSRQPIAVLIRKVQTTLKQDGLIFGGYAMPGEEPSIKHKYNSLHFEFASSVFGQEQNMEYSYFLEGFDKGWSAWNRRTEKDYTNIPAGHYVFKVKCRNNTNNESAETGFSFTVLPPWYQTWIAYIIYILCFAGLLYFFYKRQQQKYKKQQQVKLQEQKRKYDEQQKQLQLQHQLEIQENEKQIIQLKNEKLQAEVEHKNSELASSAMNLVQKKEFLSKLKEDLTSYKGNTEPDKSGKEFQKIIKLIDKELDHNEEWEQFAIHFDSVHTNYLKKLKDQFPSLTTSDLKLAAYLRLNLSSKEIAQLMNISVRGVETSRYRLRKKLGIESEENLFDHLTRLTT